MQPTSKTSKLLFMSSQITATPVLNWQEVNFKAAFMTYMGGYE